MTTEQVAVAWALFAIAFALCMFGTVATRRVAVVLFGVAALLVTLILVRIVPLLWGSP